MEKNEVANLNEPNEIDKEFDAVLEGLPEEQRKAAKFMLSATRMTSITSPEAEVMKKVTQEHISKFLESSEKEMENSYKEKAHRKLFYSFLAVVMLVFLIGVIVLLRDKPEILEKVLYALGGVLAGSFGGYGLGKSKSE